MTRLAIIDYGSGNVRSVQRALEAAANHFEIPLTVTLTDDPDRIRQADRIVLPGVGHFADCAAGLASRTRRFLHGSTRGRLSRYSKR